MPERLTLILLLSLAISYVLCNPPDKDVDDDDEYDPELRGYSEYETWKPTIAQSSAPEVILIKQKDPHYHHDSMSDKIGSAMKHHLPLLAVLAPLVAVSLLLPLKAYLGPSYIVYPPVAPPADAPDTKRERAGRVEKDAVDEQSLAAQVLNMIDEIDKLYGEMANKDKKS